MINNIAWKNLTVVENFAGAYRVFARAIDNQGLSTDSDQRRIHLEPQASGPRLEISWMGTEMLVVSWTAPGAVLETADQVSGPWTALPNAQSPHHLTRSDRARFFHLRLSPGQ